MIASRLSRFLLVAGLVLGGAACTASTNDVDAPGGQGVAVAVEPPSATVGIGGTVTFAATVTGTVDTSVSWAVVEPSGGVVDGNGLYTAPGTAGTYHVRATSVADPGSQGVATVTVTPPITVVVSPHDASVTTGGTLAFTATVTGAANTNVTWTVAEASCGSISAAGIYTAPAAPATCHVVATSVADPGRSDTATVTVTAGPAAVTVSVTPPSAALDACRTLTLTATVSGTANTAVTWSVQEGAAGGTITAQGLYTAPDVAGTYHAVATSQADPAKSAVAVIVVSERVLGVTVTPQSITIPTGGSAQFTATITTTCGTTTATKTIFAGGAGSAN